MKSSAYVIIGGGVIGCSVAYYLVKRGEEVIVIEKKPGLCYGASGANQGGCSFHYESLAINAIAKESARLYENLSNEIDYDIEFLTEKRLTCSVNEEQYPYLEKRISDLRENGIIARLIDGDEIRKLEPAIGKDIIVGIEQESGTVNPFKLNYGLGHAAQKLGAKFLFATEVKNIETAKGNIVSVITDKGKITTKFVINAAGAWSSEIGKMVGITIPIRPRRGQIIVTEPIPFNKRWRRIVDADFLTTVYDPEATEKTEDPRKKLGIAGALYQENTGNWTIGSSHEFAGYDAQVTRQTLQHIARRAIQFMPKLKDVNCIRMFAGLRSFCYADGLPILSKVDNPSNFGIASGHAGHGIALAPITGKLISELVTDNLISLPIDAFNLSRFNNTNYTSLTDN